MEELGRNVLPVCLQTAGMVPTPTIEHYPYQLDDPDGDSTTTYSRWQSSDTDSVWIVRKVVSGTVTTWTKTYAPWAMRANEVKVTWVPLHSSLSDAESEALYDPDAEA